GGNNDGQAQLFFIKLSGPGADDVWDEGSDYHVMTTGVGDALERNGLSEIEIADFSGNSIADRVYAGDLRGNLWVFDLRSTSGSWTANNPEKLFTTINNQPITSKPSITFNPDMSYNDASKPNLLVIFGSGQFLVNSDKSTVENQYIYGLWDNTLNTTSGFTEITTGDLIEQGPITNIISNGSEYRVMPDPASVSYQNGDKGWYLALPNSGERIISHSLIIDNSVIFATMIPSSTPCSLGGSGWIMALDTSNGSRTSTAIFDINNDAIVNNSDTISVSGNDVAVSGQKVEGGIPQTPGRLGSNLYTSGQNGIAAATRIGSEHDILTRQSWRQHYYINLK
ncbi:MAG: hypothetical protein HUJ30_06855, partial [Gammaproteobacteria bacterium]|nr:hypothetical protein [Gammaproteobacteria bacterium]